MGTMAAVLLPLGALGTRIEAWDYIVGFALLLLGGLIGLVGVGCGIAGIIVARRRSQDRNLWIVASGMAVSFAVVVLLGMLLLRALAAPPISQVSTDTENPPDISAILPLRGEDSNSPELDATTIRPVQELYYPWMQPLFVPAPPTEVLVSALELLEAMNMKIVANLPERGLIHAVDTTFWFGFKDDVAVRIRRYGEGSLVDVRSISRVGVSDLGTNANRVKEILRRFRHE